MIEAAGAPYASHGPLKLCVQCVAGYPSTSVLTNLHSNHKKPPFPHCTTSSRRLAASQFAVVAHDGPLWLWLPSSRRLAVSQFVVVAHDGPLWLWLPTMGRCGCGCPRWAVNCGCGCLRWVVLAVVACDWLV